MIEVFQFPCLKDNYGFILKNSQTGNCLCIDTPDADAIINFADQNSLKISHIFNTHWHPDHAGGNQKVADYFGAQCYGPCEIASHGMLNHVELLAGQTLDFDGVKIETMELSGHTFSQIGYYLPDEKIVFVGDALFVLGCGRLFEGTPIMAYAAMLRLHDLPPDVLVYCAHEYSLANAKFCASLNLSNRKLAKRIVEIENLRAQNLPTVPTNIGIEKATNPFMLADLENLKRDLNLHGLSNVDIFAHIRKLKDNF